MTTQPNNTLEPIIIDPDVLIEFLKDYPVNIQVYVTGSEPRMHQVTLTDKFISQLVSDISDRAKKPSERIPHHCGNCTHFDCFRSDPSKGTCEVEFWANGCNNTINASDDDPCDHYNPKRIFKP